MISFVFSFLSGFAHTGTLELLYGDNDEEEEMIMLMSFKMTVTMIR